MATVTVYTAERVKEVEDASVTSGSIDGSGHLILTTKGGTTVDAGMTVGQPQTGITTPIANSFMKRDVDGRSQVNTPSVSSDIATKGYVDAEITSAKGYVDAHVWDASDITTGTISNDRLPGLILLSSEEIRLSSTAPITTTLTQVSGFTKTLTTEVGDTIKILGIFNFDPADGGNLTILKGAVNGTYLTGEVISQGIRGNVNQAWVYTVPSGVSSVTITFHVYNITSGTKNLYADHTKMLVEHLR